MTPEIHHTWADVGYAFISDRSPFWLTEFDVVLASITACFVVFILRKYGS